MKGAVAAFRLDAARHPLAHALDTALDASRVPHGAPVLLAVSGGADSMALLALASGLVARDRISPIVAHVDHGLRAESASEGDAVARLAARAGLPMVRLTVSISRGSNLSARARRARYAALAGATNAHGAHWVATAHHADDQFETMIMALSRGTGLARLAGMKPARTLVPGVKLVRPLLAVSRNELRAACVALEVTWCEDPSNASESRPRGTVRHRVIPILEGTWPGCATRSARTAALLQWASGALKREVKVLEEAARTEEGFSRAVLRTAPLPVVAAFVRNSVGPKCASAVAWQVAQAIRDANRRPRTWRVSARTQVHLTARTYSSSSVALRQRL